MDKSIIECPLKISNGPCNIIERSGSVRDYPSVGILECLNCGITFHAADLRHVVDYVNGTMTMAEVNGSVEPMAPDEDDKRRGAFIRRNFPSSKKSRISVLDFGSGYGNLIQELEHEFEIEGIEIDDQARMESLKKGYRVHESLESVKKLNRKFDLITMIHVVEHLTDPVEVLKQLSSLLNENGSILIETPNADDALLISYNCLAFQNWTYWSHHPVLFNFKGLSNLLDRAQLKCVSSEPVQRYNLANHMYWLSQGRPGGHKHWAGFFSDHLNNLYQAELFERQQSDTIFVRVSN